MEWKTSKREIPDFGVEIEIRYEHKMDYVTYSHAIECRLERIVETIAGKDFWFNGNRCLQSFEWRKI